MRTYLNCFLAVIVMTLLSTHYIKAQESSERIESGEYILFDMEIHQEGGHPISAFAISKEYIDLDELNKDTLFDFLRDLYQYSYYIQEIDPFFYSLIYGTKVDDIPAFVWEYYENYEKYSTYRKRLELKSGAYIIIDAMKVTGDFLIVDKTNETYVIESSGGIRYWEVPSIQDCYFAISITGYDYY